MGKSTQSSIGTTKIIKLTKKPSTSSINAGSKVSFKWTPELQKKMASYFCRNFKKYKEMKRSEFLRGMRAAKELGIDHLSEKQMKNGFESFLKKYTDVKAKLNSSGFGIDPEVDAALDKGWVLRECPYYEDLDQVLGTRPNITPPFVIQTTSIGGIGQEQTTIGHEGSEQSVGPNGEEVIICEIVDHSEGESQELVPIVPATQDPTVLDFVRSAYSGIDQTTAAEQSHPKNALAAFTKVMGDRMLDLKQVESQKLVLENKKFEFTKELEMHKVNKEAEVEIKKIELQNDLEIRKNDLEIRKLQDKREEREFELKKLEIQMKLQEKKQD